MTKTPRRRGAPRTATPGADSRSRILAAASATFAAQGYDDASVDEIAAASGFNKAMIYYHFDGKRGLYREIIQDMFRTLGARTHAIATQDLAPAEQLMAFADAFVDETTRRPDLPFLMVREMADGARRLEPETLTLMRRVVDDLDTIIRQGTRVGVFRRTDPFIAYLSLIAPVVMFRVTAPGRTAMAQTTRRAPRHMALARCVAHAKLSTLAALNAGAPTPLSLDHALSAAPSSAAPRATLRRTAPPPPSSPSHSTRLRQPRRSGVRS